MLRNFRSVLRSQHVLSNTRYVVHRRVFFPSISIYVHLVRPWYFAKCSTLYIVRCPCVIRTTATHSTYVVYVLNTCARHKTVNVSDKYLLWWCCKPANTLIRPTTTSAKRRQQQLNAHSNRTVGACITSLCQMCLCLCVRQFTLLNNRKDTFISQSLQIYWYFVF